MTARDVPAVVDIERALFPDDAWSDAMFRAELGAVDSRRFVVAVHRADDAEEIIGYAGLAAAGGEGDILTIAVRRDHWGEGVGSAMLTELLDEARRRGCASVFLEVRADNPRARALYERFGFAEVGVRRNYYQPAGVDAIVMCLRLEDAADG